MATRHYKLINRATGDTVAVIEARSKQESLSYMAQGVWECEVASSKDVVAAVKANVPLFEAAQPLQTKVQEPPSGVDYSGGPGVGGKADTPAQSL
jgi:hypothetical protein